MQSANNVKSRPKLSLALELATAMGLALMAGFLFDMSIVTAPALVTQQISFRDRCDADL